VRVFLRALEGFHERFREKAFSIALLTRASVRSFERGWSRVLSSTRRENYPEVWVSKLTPSVTQWQILCGLRAWADTQVALRMQPSRSSGMIARAQQRQGLISLRRLEQSTQRAFE
jgi:hypothetical protein